MFAHRKIDPKELEAMLGEQRLFFVLESEARHPDGKMKENDFHKAFLQHHTQG